MGSCCGVTFGSGGGGGAQGQIIFDYVITSRDDLAAVVAPVAGEFALPAGSYAFTANVTLNAGEFITVATDVSLYGFGHTLSADGSGGATLATVTGGNIYSQDLNVTSTGSGAPAGATTNAAVTNWRMLNCNFDGDGEGFEQLEGIVDADMCSFTGQSAEGYQRPNGQTHMVNCFVTGSTNGLRIGTFRSTFTGCTFVSGTGLALASTGVGQILTYHQFTNCTFDSSAVGASRAAAFNGTSNKYHCTNCRFLCNGTLAAVLIGNAESTRLIDCTIDCGGAQSGIQITGNINHLYINADIQNGAASGIIYNIGAVVSAVVNGSRCDSSFSNFISWAAASIPSDGLLVCSCASEATAFAAGFTAASARVNIKCCTNNAGLETETAIVP